jgi:hypothetical protein
MVRTAPEGATVALGGEDVQTSPATFKSIKLGSYPVHISLDGYEPVDQTAEIKDNQFTDLGTVSLVRSTGTLQITSIPPDSDYTLKNDILGIARSGKCPDVLKQIPIGTYEITIIRDGWQIKGTISVRRNETALFNPQFTYGSVAITSDPSGASVSENGKVLGITPITVDQLPAGSHTFVFSLSDYKTTSASADVSANAVANLSATLQRIVFGVAKVSSKPSGATVFENGQNLGQTPLNVKELTLGQHTYSLGLPGYKTTSVSADITADTVTLVSATLTQSIAGIWSGAGTQTGTDNGRVTTYPWRIIVKVSEDEKTATLSGGGGNDSSFPATRDGETLTWDDQQTGTWTMHFLGNGKATCKSVLTYNENSGGSTEATLTRR